MSDLRLNLKPLTFDELVSLGRSIIPTVAPAWTDHNVHDPGMMLIDLVSWIAEAQMYSLSRVRKDERLAYARLLGVTPRGPVPARGLIWPLDDERGQVTPPTWEEGAAVDAGSTVTSDRPDAPAFTAAHTVALTTARLVRVESRFADGTSSDWTTSNARDGATFLPFGETPATGDRLILTFEMKAGEAAKFKSPLSLGFEIRNDGTRPVDGLPPSRRTRLTISHQSAGESRPIRLLDDTTGGLLDSGVLLLEVSAPVVFDGPADPAAPVQFSIAIGSATGNFLRSPRVQRIAVNVIAVTQIATVADEMGELRGGQPDQVYMLKQTGLVFPFTAESFNVQLFESQAFAQWTEVADLSLSSPDDRHYELDWQTGTLRFGNGINGRIPADGTTIRVSYQICAGIRGNLPARTRWTVFGLAGPFGANSEAMTGGGEAQGLRELRGMTRFRSQNARPLVTALDLEAEALLFTDLGIKRAHELTGRDGCPAVRGSRILAVVGEYESPDLLDEVRSRLAPRLPLGQRLEVIGPRYVPFRVIARLRAARNTDPKDVERDAEARLRQELAIVTPAGQEPWPFGRDVTPLAVKGWLRTVPGVASVIDLKLLADDGGAAVKIGPRQLPRFEKEAGDLNVDDATARSTR